MLGQISTMKQVIFYVNKFYLTKKKFYLCVFTSLSCHKKYIGANKEFFSYLIFYFFLPILSWVDKLFFLNI